jgi:pyruvate/2-oxoacid:ferredoxin oxidoreductase beta subunit/Pyruvate/2-oxoacid:ferredoxin oxidoreductase gamma subunit
VNTTGVSPATYATYLTEEVGPLPFCPGCGHHVVIKSLDKALVKLQLDPRKVVIVTDIGCIGLTDRYFITNAFHGLHGRAVTYACGLKLARPELTVVALMGDGGCGIGGTHVLNVARRNIGITLIVANNFNYGMTGGQHSLTTPSDGITPTTPWGNVEGPMDLCGTALAAGAAWVARCTMFDKDLADVVALALAQPGFALLDVWELCTAYYARRNRIKKKELDDLLERHGLQLGVLADRPRPEYSVRYREAHAAHRPPRGGTPAIDVCYTNSVERQTGIILAGGAGQKIKSTATLFAQAAMFSGLEATQKDDYPITVMTGHSLAELIFSRQPIDYTASESPDYLLAVSADGLAAMRDRIKTLPDTCTIYAEQRLDLPASAARVIRLPIAQAAAAAGKESLGLVTVAAMLADTRLFPLEALARAVSTFQAAALAEVSRTALQAGAAMVPRAPGSPAP